MGENKKIFIPQDHVFTDKEKEELRESKKEKETAMLRHLDTKKDITEHPISFKPAPNRILVEKMKEEIKSSIIIPEQFKKFTNKGVVVKLGLETPEKPQLYKLGDKVFFPATATVIPIEEDGRFFVVVNQFDIFATEE